MYRSHVLVCGGTGCTSSNSAAIIEALEKEIEAKGLSDEMKSYPHRMLWSVRFRPNYDSLS